MWQLLLEGSFINQTQVWTSTETQMLKAVVALPGRGLYFSGKGDLCPYREVCIRKMCLQLSASKIP